jgi:hypothetical protein
VRMCLADGGCAVGSSPPPERRPTAVRISLEFPKSIRSLVVHIPRKRAGSEVHPRAT